MRERERERVVSLHQRDKMEGNFSFYYMLFVGSVAYAAAAPLPSLRYDQYYEYGYLSEETLSSREIEEINMKSTSASSSTQPPSINNITKENKVFRFKQHVLLGVSVFYKVWEYGLEKKGETTWRWQIYIFSKFGGKCDQKDKEEKK